jgi:hypothetical protein
MVTASSIFGEPQYYRSGEFAEKSAYSDGSYFIDALLPSNDLLMGDHYAGKKTSEVMEELIDKSLDFDFKGTLDWAMTLRNTFFMRLNPQIMMVRAAMHKNRVDFDKENPGIFKKIEQSVMSRADEPASQLTYWIYRNGSKARIPSILKRSWAKKIESLNRYQISKYKNSGIGLVDTVRICHAHNPIINELMRTGTVSINENQGTWESYISKNGSTKESWNHVIDNIFTEEA